MDILQLLFPFGIILFSIIIHEFAHGYVAYVLGDGTASRAGRLTLNPIPHIDFIGSIIVPSLSFMTAGTFLGWAKPVPVNLHNIRQKYGEVAVASAGVISNILLAVVCGIVYKIAATNGFMTEGLSKALFMVITVNVSLAFFNLIPIPPFDGMAILQGFFPRLQFSQTLIYNPFYIVFAIILASNIYMFFSPFIFGFVINLIS